MKTISKSMIILLTSISLMAGCLPREMGVCRSGNRPGSACVQSADLQVAETIIIYGYV